MELQLKQMLMSAVEIRADLIERITNMDERFLQAMHQIAVAYDSRDIDPIIGYSVQGDPMYASVAKEEFKRRFEAVDEGEFITLEELKKESETWLKGTAATK